MTSTPLKISDISIIIPTLNEEENIGLLPKSLNSAVGEVLVVDGGSNDKTIPLAKEKGFRVLSAPPGRAAQLNHGAAASRGSLLLFLHADSKLPENFTTPILASLETKGVIAGAFSLAIDGNSPALTFIAHCANIRSRLLKLPYGDQALFIRKKRFKELGCFPLLPIMEDYVFMQKASKAGEVITLPQKVITSARRWKKLGIIRTTLINQLVVLGYVCNISPEKLASLYRR